MSACLTRTSFILDLRPSKQDGCSLAGDACSLQELATTASCFVVTSCYALERGAQNSPAHRHAKTAPGAVHRCAVGGPIHGLVRCSLPKDKPVAAKWCDRLPHVKPPLAVATQWFAYGLERRDLLVFVDNTASSSFCPGVWQ
eukprot:2193772-Amphidinium_carterae.2